MKTLREGFTTGSCAAAAALGCCLWLRDGKCPDQVSVVVPEGRVYMPEIIPHPGKCCGVMKDGGDDPDVTNGMEVTARVELLDGDGAIAFCAGEGIGTVTEIGLKIPPGEAAINPVPRKMIEDAVRGVFGARSARVTISIPGGREAASKTFNPRLGIRGGLSILGTSGVVRPMSDEAMKDALYEELKMRVAQGERRLIFTFGNQGEAAMRALFPAMRVVQAGNVIGFMLDSAVELGVESIVLGGHSGKLCKIAAGVMQTHSRIADTRREAIITQLALMGAPTSLIESVYGLKTTDAAIGVIAHAGFSDVWNLLARAAREYCSLRVRGGIGMSVVLMDRDKNVLGRAMEDAR